MYHAFTVNDLFTVPLFLTVMTGVFNLWIDATVEFIVFIVFLNRCRIGLGTFHDLNNPVTGFGDGVIDSGTNSRHDCRAECRSLIGTDGGDFAAVNIRLQLFPEPAFGSAAGGANLLDSDSQCAHDFERIAHGEGNAFQHRPDQMLTLVTDGQTDEAATGVGVLVWCTLTGEIGQEQQPSLPMGACAA